MHLQGSPSVDDYGHASFEMPRHPGDVCGFETNATVARRSANGFGQSFTPVHSNLPWSPIEFLEDVREGRGCERVWPGDFALLFHDLGDEERARWRRQARATHDDWVRVLELAVLEDASLAFCAVDVDGPRSRAKGGANRANPACGLVGPVGQSHAIPAIPSRDDRQHGLLACSGLCGPQRAHERPTRTCMDRGDGPMQAHDGGTRDDARYEERL